MNANKKSLQKRTWFRGKRRKNAPLRRFFDVCHGTMCVFGGILFAFEENDRQGKMQRPFMHPQL